MTFERNAAAGSLFLGKVLYANVSAVASSETPNYPVSALVDWRYPRRTWRSATTGAQTITFDLAAPPPHAGMYLRGANFTNATLSVNQENSWTTPIVSHVLQIPRDAFLDRRHTMVFWHQNRRRLPFRYVRLAIPEQEPTTDVGYFELGVGLAVVEPLEVELRAPIQISRRQAMLKNDLLTRREVQRIGDRQLVLTMPWTWAWDQVLDTPDNETDLMHAMAVSEDEPVIVCWNVNRPDLSILALREGDITIDSTDGIGAQMPLTFLEVM